VDITGDYFPVAWGDTPGPHKKGVIRFTLEMFDGFLERYRGKGEMVIMGELKPRNISIYDLRIRSEEEGPARVVTIRRDSEPRIAEKFDGTLKADELFLNQDGWGLKFRGTLHRGNDADYETLLRSPR